MNRYKVQYIVDVVRKNDGRPLRLEEVRNPVELLKILGLYGGLTAREVMEVSKEIMDVVEAEQFKSNHVMYTSIRV